MSGLNDMFVVVVDKGERRFHEAKYHWFVRSGNNKCLPVAFV